MRAIIARLGEPLYSERRDLPGNRTDAFEDALEGVPVVVVWEAERL